MAATDRIIIGIQPGQLYLQPDSTFTESQWGFDEGVRKFLTHPKTQKNQWPQRNQPDDEWTNMFVTNVIPRDDESGLKELVVYYKGVMRFRSENMKERLLPGSDVSMFTLPAKSNEGHKVNYVAPVPKPRVSREYLSLTKPTMTGVGSGLSGNPTWLPQTPSFTISFVPDPDEAQTVNLLIGWVLDDRSWQDIADRVFLVREDVSLYYPLAV